MPKKSHTPEEIVRKLREAEIGLPYAIVGAWG